MAIKTPQEDSGNAAADGNFSIQVLTKAVEVWNLTCIPATSQAAVGPPSCHDPAPNELKAHSCHAK